MLSAGMKFFTDIPLTVVGMLIFFCFFVGAVIWTFRVRSLSYYQQVAELPLREEGE